MSGALTILLSSTANAARQYKGPDRPKPVIPAFECSVSVKTVTKTTCRHIASRVSVVNPWTNQNENVNPGDILITYSPESVVRQPVLPGKAHSIKASDFAPSREPMACIHDSFTEQKRATFFQTGPLGDTQLRNVNYFATYFSSAENINPKTETIMSLDSEVKCYPKRDTF